MLPAPPQHQALAEVRRLPPQGELVATPAFSGVDQPVVVRGSGFAPGKAVALNWMTYIGNRMSGRGWEENSRTVAEATADAAGNVAFHFKAPDDLGGAHVLWADAGGARKSGMFYCSVLEESLRRVPTSSSTCSGPVRSRCRNPST